MKFKITYLCLRALRQDSGKAQDDLNNVIIRNK